MPLLLQTELVNNQNLAVVMVFLGQSIPLGRQWAVHLFSANVYSFYVAAYHEALRNEVEVLFIAITLNIPPRFV